MTTTMTMTMTIMMTMAMTVAVGITMAMARKVFWYKGEGTNQTIQDEDIAPHKITDVRLRPYDNTEGFEH